MQANTASQPSKHEGLSAQEWEMTSAPPIASGSTAERVVWGQAIEWAAAHRNRAWFSGLWGAQEAMGAMDARAKKNGAPFGWGRVWSLQAASAVKANILRLDDPGHWEELIWALGTGEWAKKLRWNRAETATGSATEAMVRQKENGPLIEHWARRSGHDLAGGEPSLDNARAMVRAWVALGGALSVKTWHPGESRWVPHAERDAKVALIATTMIAVGAGSNRALALLEAGAPARESADNCAPRFLEWAAPNPLAADCIQMALSMGVEFDSEKPEVALLAAISARAENNAVFLCRALGGGSGDPDTAAFQKGFLRVSENLAPESRRWMQKLSSREEAWALAREVDRISPPAVAEAREMPARGRCAKRRL